MGVRVEDLRAGWDLAWRALRPRSSIARGLDRRLPSRPLSLRTSDERLALDRLALPSSARRPHLRRHAPLAGAAPRSARADSRRVPLRGAKRPPDRRDPLARGPAPARNGARRPLVGRARLGGAARPGRRPRGALPPHRRPRVPVDRARERDGAGGVPRRARRPPAAPRASSSRPTVRTSRRGGA